MRLIDILRNLSLQVTSQRQIEHRCVRQIQFLIEFGRLFAQLLHIACHITNDNGIENGAKGAKDEA